MKLSLVDYETQMKSDDLKYYYYSVELYFHNELPQDNYPLHNLGLPIFLGSIYKLIPEEYFNALLFQNIQRLFSVFVSSFTIPLVYLLCHKFFEKKYALLGSFMFAFDPRLVQNSTFGITDPLFLFFSIASFVLFYSKSNKLVLASFVLIGLASLTRLEGILLYPLFLILLIRNHKISKKHLKFLSLIILLPIVYIIIFDNLNGIDVEFGNRIIIEIMQLRSFYEDGVIMNGTHKNFSEMVFNSLLYYFWSSFPTFFFFIPLGLYCMFKNKLLRWELILIVFFLSISGIVAYFDAYDVRYFFPVYPFFIIISLFCIKKLYG